MDGARPLECVYRVLYDQTVTYMCVCEWYGRPWEFCVPVHYVNVVWMVNGTDGPAPREFTAAARQPGAARCSNVRPVTATSSSAAATRALTAGNLTLASSVTRSTRGGAETADVVVVVVVDDDDDDVCVDTVSAVVTLMVAVAVRLIHSAPSPRRSGVRVEFEKATHF